MTIPLPKAMGAFAIVPSNDLPATIPFWQRLGFALAGRDEGYVIMTGWGSEVHLTQAGTGPRRVPAEHSPSGVFIRTSHVAAIAARVEIWSTASAVSSATVIGASTKLGSAVPTDFSFASAGRPTSSWTAWPRAVGEGVPASDKGPYGRQRSVQVVSFPFPINSVATGQRSADGRANDL
jgi:hypothetical protein